MTDYVTNQVHMGYFEDGKKHGLGVEKRLEQKLNFYGSWKKG
jgi:hypothetical protein